MKRMGLRSLWIPVTICLLSGCTGPSKTRLPPVTEGWHRSNAITSGYRVQPHETLYSIAWSFGVDYRQLAALNKIHPPYKLRCGQRLIISKSLKRAAPQPKNSKLKTAAIIQPSGSRLSSVSSEWRWPTHGRVKRKFYISTRHKNLGLDITGQLGQPIFASNSGTIVYTGTGIKSYGKLIIIKHNEDYLSAYAYNEEILVKENHQVIAGQKIATMGQGRDGHPTLHFEIRRSGKPVNPLGYLPKP